VLQAFPYDGELAKAKIILSHQLEGLWRWQVEGGPLWLMQLLTIEGSGAFGQGAIFLLEGRHLIELNSGGQFFVHEIATRRVAHSGRFVDAEIMLYTPEAYYWSSYEGAHFVQLRFPGLPGLYSFHQFASVLNRPEIIEARLAGASDAPPPRLVPPPVMEARLVEEPSGGRRVKVEAHSSEGLAQLRLYEDGLLVADEPIVGSRFAGDLVLPAGGNARWVTAQAADQRGLISAPQMLPLKPAGGAPARLLGVLVGVDSYGEERLKLSYAKSDARRLAHALQASVGRYYGAENSHLLLDEQATPGAIAAELEGMVAAADPHDTLVFSFAGHGVKGDDERYYLAPFGYRSDDPRGSGLSWTQVSSILGRAKARVVVIPDACHSGLSGAEGLGTNDDAVACLLTGTRAPMLVLAASKGRQFSYEDPKWGGGAFTHALVEVLKNNWQSADLNGNGVNRGERALSGAALNCDKQDAGSADALARQAGPHRRFRAVVMRGLARTGRHGCSP
jgi:hypothetical protein